MRLKNQEAQLSGRGLNNFQKNSGKRAAIGYKNKMNYRGVPRTERLRGYIYHGRAQNSGILSVVQALNGRGGLTSLTQVATKDGTKLSRFFGLVDIRGRFANLKDRHPTTHQTPVYTEGRFKSYKKSSLARVTTQHKKNNVSIAKLVSGKQSRLNASGGYWRQAVADKKYKRTQQR